MSKQDNGTGNVHQLHRDKATKIEPPTDHADRVKVRGSRLHMRAGPGEDENLVCLYDVVAWLMTAHGLPLKRAIDKVASAFDGGDRDTFFMSGDDYASPHDPTSPFLKFVDNPESLAAASVRFLGMTAFDLSRMVNEPGQLSSLEFDETKETPFEYFGRTDACRCAVTWRKAHELWGWGRVVTEQDQATEQPAPVPEETKLKKIKEKDQSPEWTAQRLLARQQELKTQGVKDYAAKTAKEAGISIRAANRRIGKAKQGGAVAVIADQLKAAGNKSKAA